MNSDKHFYLNDHYFLDKTGKGPILKTFLYKNPNTIAKRAAHPAIPIGPINNLLKNPNF